MKKIIVFALLAFIIPSISFGAIGVGVGTGKIYMDQKLKAGGVYELPILSVLNTGDEPSDYGVSVSFREYQKELKPDPSWLSFSPDVFYLEPGGVQAVNVKVTLPLKTPPGDYFAFLEAHPVKVDKGDGTTSVKIAAAAKLYFTVAPANFLQGLYYRLTYLFNHYSPWTYIVLAVIALATLFTWIRKKFDFQFKVGKKK